MQVQHFLLVFDHRRATLVSVDEFGTDSQAASEAYKQAELRHRHDNDIDIVLVGSDSIETVRLTHANYFDGTASVSKYLAGLL